MTDFAPGKWHVRKDTFSVYSNFGRSVVKVADTRQKLFTPECQIANARLIAAAPDLLHALEIARDHLEVSNHEGEEDETLALINSAIAKAKGA